MWLRGTKLIVVGLLSCCAIINSAALAQQADKSSKGVSPKAPYAVEELVLGISSIPTV